MLRLVLRFLVLVVWFMVVLLSEMGCGGGNKDFRGNVMFWFGTCGI